MTHRVTFTHTKPDGATFYNIRNNPSRPAELDAHAELESTLAAAEADGRIESMSFNEDGNTLTAVINYRDEDAYTSVKDSAAVAAYNTALAAYNTANGITVEVAEETV
jgi:hypothetical protein